MIELWLVHKASFYSFKVRNHASPAVCAAVSAVTQGLAGFLINHQDSVRDLVYRLNSGDSEVSFRSDDKFIEGAFELVKIAVLQVQKGYPDELSVTCE